MLQVVRKPCAALAPFVETFWYFEGDLPHARERILPNGRMQLIVNLHEDELRSYHGQELASMHRMRGAVLCGAYAGHFAIDTAEQRQIMGASFTPGGAFPFFRPPCDVTTETHVELDQVWGREGELVRERLAEAKTPEARLGRLEALLLERALRPLEPDGAVAFALAAFERDLPVAAVTERIGLAPKTFIRRFSERVGLTPKRFARIQRFQRVLGALEAGRSVNWASVAVGCGYFDQAHLIHDFRAFSGIRPTQYVSGGTGGRNHVRIDNQNDEDGGGGGGGGD